MSVPIELNSDTCMYWCGCLVKDGDIIYKVTDVEEEEEYDEIEGEYYYTYRLVGIDKYSNTEILSDDVDPYLPKLGYRQIGKTAVFYSRVKQTQYKKGLHMDYILRFCPQESELEAINEYGLIDQFGNIFNLVEQDYTPIDKAIELIESRDRWAVAIHNWWAIVLKVDYDNPLLYYKRIPVGEIVDGDVKFFEGQSERKFWLEVNHES